MRPLAARRLGLRSMHRRLAIHCAPA